MAINIPATFKEKVKGNNYWFFKRGEIEDETLVVEETKVLQNETVEYIYKVGIKEKEESYVYYTVTSLTTTDEDNIFNVRLTYGNRVIDGQLIATKEKISKLAQDVVEQQASKTLHLVTGVQGPKGDKGESVYDLWRKEHGDVSEAEFIKAINRAYESGKNILDIESKFNSLIAQVNNSVKELTNNNDRLQEVLDLAQDELPIGAIVFSHTNPKEDYWLPFGIAGRIYEDKDYPELARIVKTWGDAYVTSSTQFNLGDATTENRYLIAGGGEITIGKTIDSQLPNHTHGFKETNQGNPHGSRLYGGGDNNYTVINEISKWDADTTGVKNNAIYKDDVTKVYGHCIAYHCWIKAKWIIEPK